MYCREFKRFDLRDKTVEESEDAFIERVYEFCFACLNARSNGTIYFGVEDGATGQYQHGQIVGLWLSPNQKKKLQEILEQNLTSTYLVFVHRAENAAVVAGAISICWILLLLLPCRLSIHYMSSMYIVSSIASFFFYDLPLQRKMRSFFKDFPAKRRLPSSLASSRCSLCRSP